MILRGPQLLLYVWAVLGVVLFLLQAVGRLVGYTLEALPTLTALQWGIVGVWVPFMIWSEGHRGFYKRFSPVAVKRALWLARNPAPVRVIFAPFFAMGFFSATRRRLITSWGLTAAIAVIVVVVKQVPQPWRGIVDSGVVVGLLYGTATVVIWAVRGLRGEDIPLDAALPDGLI